MPWALRSVMPTLAAMSRSHTPGSWAGHSGTRAWLVRKLQPLTLKYYQQKTRKILLVFCCLCKLVPGTGEQVPTAGQLPRVNESRGHPGRVGATRAEAGSSRAW